MLKQMTLWDMTSDTGSQELGGGLSHSDSLVFQMTSGSIQAPVPVSRSPSQGEVKRKTTQDTCGHAGSVLSADCTLSSLLASKCQKQLSMDGSMEYSQTWQKRATPAGLLYWEHTASSRRTSGRDSGGVASAGFPTPVSGDEKWRFSTVDSAKRRLESGKQMCLEAMGHLLVGYGTPSARDYKDTPGMSQTGVNPDGSVRKRNDQLPRQIHGLITQSVNSVTDRPGVLDAAFSRWLMGYPEQWCQVSPNYDRWQELQERIARLV